MKINIALPDTFRDVPITSVRDNIGIKSGVYIFYDIDSTALYVGKTSKFTRRMKEHAKSSPFFHMSEHVRVYELKSEYEKDILESYLINTLKPQYNKAKTFYMQEDYEEMLYEIDERIDELVDRLTDLKEVLNPFDYSETYTDAYYESEEEYDEYEEISNNLDKVAIQREIDEINYEISKLRKRKQSITLRKSN
jgi:predicted GIY-YIG superfamily endonuclease